ncbi:hypothetical protein WOSG25_180350 [Weissella oryzae SG25]|uniref:Uncharacterized protein n=1 Tax=Weissella oryzae (strain DSM 25784 / JCM 18191 / LMG 30913 / SG25) TaxID=1329250 RepID=A0A069CWP6_WEIOS|nr:hypothetical protein [Weissella oryzae]GAK31884.1 hypothetical protein WOSG25_180350 [Weissella oryzae SG25]
MFWKFWMLWQIWMFICTHPWMIVGMIIFGAALVIYVSWYELG